MATSSSSINLTAEELVSKPKASEPPAADVTATRMIMPSAIATLRPGDATQPGSTGWNGTNPSNTPLSGGSVAGVAVGACAGLTLIGAAVFWILRRRKKQRKGDAADLDIKPYEFTTPQASGSAAGGAGGGAGNSRFAEERMSDGTGYHVEKDGQAIQSPVQSPSVERDSQLILSREQSPRPGPNGAVYEMG